MIKRLVRSTTTEQLLERFKAVDITGNFQTSYNIAPGNKIAVITNDGKHNVIASHRWGIISTWGKKQKKNKELINLKSESILRTPQLLNAFKTQRCLIVVDGFYLWKTEEDNKRPNYFKFKNNQAYSIAGIWMESSEWKTKKTYSCAIITTDANDLIKPFSKKMPAIIPKPNESFWLDPKNSNEHILQNLLRPYPFYLMDTFEVSDMVNFMENSNEECIKPYDHNKPDGQMNLFKNQENLS